MEKLSQQWEVQNVPKYGSIFSCDLCDGSYHVKTAECEIVIISYHLLTQ